MNSFLVSQLSIFSKRCNNYIKLVTNVQLYARLSRCYITLQINDQGEENNKLK